MTKATRNDIKVDVEPDLKERFTVKPVDKSTELLIDNLTGVEYLKMYPTQYRKASETVTCIPLLDNSGFPSINKDFKDKK